LHRRDEIGVIFVQNRLAWCVEKVEEEDHHNDDDPPKKQIFEEGIQRPSSINKL
jgi:hypothetical protein